MGETLAIMQAGSPIVKLWDSNQGVESSLDTNLKQELTYMKWNNDGKVLAIGTQKGSLLLYSKRARPR